MSDPLETNADGVYMSTAELMSVSGCGVRAALIYIMRCHGNGRRVSQKTPFIYALLCNIPEETGIRLVLPKNAVYWSAR